jgi:hypothetical protein
MKITTLKMVIPRYFSPEMKAVTREVREKCKKYKSASQKVGLQKMLHRILNFILDPVLLSLEYSKGIPRGTPDIYFYNTMSALNVHQLGDTRMYIG